MYRFSIDDLQADFKNYFSKRTDIHHVHDYLTRHVYDLNLANNKKSFLDHAIMLSVHVVPFFGSRCLNHSQSVKHFQTQFKTKLIHTYK